MLQYFKKIYKNPKFQNKRIRKQSKDFKEINPNSLEAIKTLRIPKNNSGDYDLIEINAIAEEINLKDIQTIKDIQDIINKTLKEIQDIFKKPSKEIEINKLLTHKDRFIENGLKYEDLGNFYVSYSNFYFALELAKKLNQKEEAEILNEAVDRMKSKINKKQIDKFYKKYIKSA